jgi:hypothetical protein
VTNYPRYLYLNPIEGVLISYKQSNKFPHQPNTIINLQDITTLEFLQDSKWYHKANCYYFKLATEKKTQIFFDDNLDVVNFTIN